MEIVTYTDPRAFAERARPLLLRDEARHNLQLGVSSTLVEHPETYPEFHLWLAEEEGGPVCALLWTPPFHPVVSQPLVPEAIPVLARSVHAERRALTGIGGATPEVDRFAEAWSELTGAPAEREMGQRIYRLEEVREREAVPGRMRQATVEDRDLVVEWILAFAREALPPGEPEDRARTERFADLRLRQQGGGYVLWEDPEPVSLVGYGGFTPNGARIGPVYTPPELRGRGYATALTAEVSARLLREGRRFCFLFTDLANPTSNRIYQRIGYEPVCDAVRYRFATGVPG